MNALTPESPSINVQIDEYYADIDPQNILLATRNLAKNPYPGLRPFRTSESPVFFGRENICFELIHRLSDHNFLSVIGASGSGKSSLIRAGLLPSLQSLPGKHGEWRVAICRPGNNPFANLAKAISLGKIFADLTFDQIYAELKESSFGFESLYLKYNRQEKLTLPFNTLIIVDQFEELFRFRKENGIAGLNETALFIKMLVSISENKDLNTYVLLTMRSEYLNECVKMPGLAEKINRGQFLVPALTVNQLKDVITKPLAFTVSTAEEGLDNKLIGEMNDINDPLPVLQHALRASYDEALQTSDSKRIVLKYEDYTAIGKMSDALNRHGNQLFDELTPLQQHYCKLLFQALTTQTSESFGIRRPTSFLTIQKICSGRMETNLVEVKPELLVIIDKFRADNVNFLMPPMPNAIEDDTEIDISHESLMRIWDKLKVWMLEESNAAINYKKFAEGAKEFDDKWVKADALQGQQLIRATNWLANPSYNQYWARRYGDDDFDRVERYIKKSQQKDLKTKLLNKIAYYVVPLIAIIIIGVFLFRDFQDNIRKARDQKIYAETLKKNAEEQLKINYEREKVLDSLIKTQRESNTLRKALDSNAILLLNNQKLAGARKVTIDSINFTQMPFYVSPLLNNEVKVRSVTKLLLPLKNAGNEKGIKRAMDAIHKTMSALMLVNDDPNKAIEVLREAGKIDNNLVVRAVTDSLLKTFVFYQQKKVWPSNLLYNTRNTLFSGLSNNYMVVDLQKGFKLLDFNRNISLTDQPAAIESNELVKLDKTFALSDPQHLVYYRSGHLITYNIPENKIEKDTAIVEDHENISAISANGRIFAVTTDNKRYYRIFKNEGSRWRELNSGKRASSSTQEIVALRFSPDGNYLAVAWNSGALTVVDQRNDREIQFTNATKTVNYVRILGIDIANNKIASVYTNGNINIYTITKPTSAPQVIDGKGQYFSDALITRLSPTGKYLLLVDYKKATLIDISSNDGKVKNLGYEPPYSALNQQFQTGYYDFRFSDALFINDNTLIALNGSSNECRLYDLSKHYESARELNNKITSLPDIYQSFNHFLDEAQNKKKTLYERKKALNKAAALNEQIKKEEDMDRYRQNFIEVKMTGALLEHLNKTPNYSKIASLMKDVEKQMPNMSEDNIDSIGKGVFFAELAWVELLSGKPADALGHINQALLYNSLGAIVKKNQPWVLLLNKQPNAAERQLKGLAKTTFDSDELDFFDNDALFDYYPGVNREKKTLYKTLFKRDLELLIKAGILRATSKEVLAIKKILN